MWLWTHCEDVTCKQIVLKRSADGSCHSYVLCSKPKPRAIKDVRLEMCVGYAIRNVAMGELEWMSSE